MLELGERLGTNDPPVFVPSASENFVAENSAKMSSPPSDTAAQGAEGSTRSTSAPNMSNIEIDEVVTVPNVEVKHAPFQSQPTLRGQLSDEEVKEMGEKMRKEQAKKYFSLRVRVSFLCQLCITEILSS